MYYTEKSFSNPVDFLNYFLNWNNNLDGYIFRGHSSDKYELVPSSLRKQNQQKLALLTPEVLTIGDSVNLEITQIHREYSLLRRFYGMADRQGLRVPLATYLRERMGQDLDRGIYPFLYGEHTWIPHGFEDVAALAQHYGIPTRLLDWTYDPFVAVYFALKDAQHSQEGNLCIWCMNKQIVSSPFYTLEDVSIRFITPPYFDNPNLNAQKGLFTLVTSLDNVDFREKFETKIDRRPLDEIIREQGDENCTTLSTGIFHKITLPCNMAAQANIMLDKFGYGIAKLFPGYSGIAHQILKDYEL